MKKYKKYSDKFHLAVVDLTQIKLAAAVASVYQLSREKQI